MAHLRKKCFYIGSDEDFSSPTMLVHPYHQNFLEILFPGDI